MPKLVHAVMCRDRLEPAGLHNAGRGALAAQFHTGIVVCDFDTCQNARCYHVTNEEVRAKIQQASGPHEDLLATVKRHKLQWYGHVSRSLGLAKTILQGTVKGGRRQGRQRKRWEDNIREWTGLEFAMSQRVGKSSAVLQGRPWRVRDR